VLPFDEVNQRVWDVAADIFIPAAASRLVTKEHVDRLAAAGCQVISSGANVPFKESDVFFGDNTEYVDGQLSLIPDFIANCGMARVFAYLMQKTEIEVTDEAIFHDVSATIRHGLEELTQMPGGHLNLTRRALNIALGKLVAQ
jgi:glutamate dehydrogenase/leucine dehydrogenase